MPFSDRADFGILKCNIFGTESLILFIYLPDMAAYYLHRVLKFWLPSFNNDLFIVFLAVFISILLKKKH